MTTPLFRLIFVVLIISMSVPLSVDVFNSGFRLPPKETHQPLLSLKMKEGILMIITKLKDLFICNRSTSLFLIEVQPFSFV